MKRYMVIGLAGSIMCGLCGHASAQNVLSVQKPPLMATQDGRVQIGRGKDYVPSTVDARTEDKFSSVKLEERSLVENSLTAWKNFRALPS